MAWQQGNCSIRSGQWPYTRYRDGTEELYATPAILASGPSLQATSALPRSSQNRAHTP
jgi:hypothetical protein